MRSSAKAIFATEIKKNLRLPFAGEVSLKRTSPSFCIGKLFGMPLWLSGESRGALGGASFIPAWWITKATEGSGNDDHPAKVANMFLLKKKLTMVLPEYLTYGTFDSIELEVPELTPAPEIVGKKNIELVRPVLEEEVPSRAAAAAKAKAKAKAKGKAKGRGGAGTADTADDAEVDAGHGVRTLKRGLSDPSAAYGDRGALSHVRATVKVEEPQQRNKKSKQKDDKKKGLTVEDRAKHLLT